MRSRVWQGTWTQRQGQTLPKRFVSIFSSLLQRFAASTRSLSSAVNGSALEWAKKNGWDTLTESHQVSEVASIDFASRHCEMLGIDALLRIPTDVPLLRSVDVEDIFAGLDEAPSCVIAPSRDGTGTNALLRSPPRAFPSFFGKNSLARHREAARAAGVAIKIIHNPRIELDVDEPDDLELLRGMTSANSHTGRWFSERGRVPQAVSDPLQFRAAQPH